MSKFTLNVVVAGDRVFCGWDQTGEKIWARFDKDPVFPYVYCADAPGGDMYRDPECEEITLVEFSHRVERFLD